MNRYLHAMVCLALAAEIHGTDAAVVSVAKQMAKELPRRYRPDMYKIIEHKTPCLLVQLMVSTIPDWIFSANTEESPAPTVRR